MKQIADAYIYKIGCLDMSVYKCINTEYSTNEVVITGKQLIHIKDRHPEAYDNTINYIEKILKAPDYIIKDKRPNTGLVIGQFTSCDKHILLVLRICTSNNKKYKNSVITSWEISKSRLRNYLKNKQILY
ncbi:MAG: hypothetical protein HFG80_12760 [Eubacterium sp.]|nr:hypothetical protein [Eubacterium sp.]